MPVMSNELTGEEISGESEWEDLPDIQEETESDDSEPETKSESKKEAKEEKVNEPESVREVESKKVETSTEYNAKLVELYQKIRPGLTGLSKDEKQLDQMAVSLAKVQFDEIESLRREIGQTKEDVFAATPQGQQALQLMNQFKGLPREVALQMVNRFAADQLKLEKAGAGKRETSKSDTLSYKEKRVAQALGLSQKDYLESRKIIETGKFTNAFDEVSIPIPTIIKGRSK